MRVLPAALAARAGGAAGRGCDRPADERLVPAREPDLSADPRVAHAVPRGQRARKSPAPARARGRAAAGHGQLRPPRSGRWHAIRLGAVPGQPAQPV